MARKTPKHVLKLMKKQQETMRWVDEVLHVKRTVPVENQASHVRDKPEEYWVGIADATNNMLEASMHDASCYAGFCYQSSKPERYSTGELFFPRCSHESPGYAGWRREYYVRG